MDYGKTFPEESCDESYNIKVRRGKYIYKIPKGWSMGGEYPYDVYDSAGNVHPADDFFVEKDDGVENVGNSAGVIGETTKNVSSALKNNEYYDLEEYSDDKYKRIKEFNYWKECLEGDYGKEYLEGDKPMSVKEGWNWLINKPKFKKRKQSSLWVEIVEKRIFELIRDNEPDFDRKDKGVKDEYLGDIKIIRICDIKSRSVFVEIKELRGRIQRKSMGTLISLAEKINEIKTKKEKSGQKGGDTPWRINKI